MHARRNTCIPWSHIQFVLYIEPSHESIHMCATFTKYYIEHVYQAKITMDHVEITEYTDLCTDNHIKLHIHNTMVLGNMYVSTV